MSVMGVWVVGAVPDDEARALSRHAARRGTGDEDLPPVHAQALAWWSGGGDAERFFDGTADGSGGASPTPAALRFAELVHCNTAPDDEPALTLQDELMELMPTTGGDGPFAAVARKASPVAALLHGLGAEASALLPGRFGEFLLSHDEVVAALPRVVRALDVSGARRDEVLSRVAGWMRGMGDAPEFDGAELLDAPVRVLRHAARSGLGAAAFSRWY
ncbi:hypothetical protein PV341_05990 [Streptomyces sp. PA03-1a]|nr:hypothetical protein [Streptomyces sp. PA03-1a]MDX2818072.1 hypothetical protein [Streptomyces sp. PA03-5A]